MGLKINDLGAIELLGMEFHANHGCLEEEKTNGNTFIVDFLGHTGIRKQPSQILLSIRSTIPGSTG